MINQQRNPKEKILYYLDNCGPDNCWKTLAEISAGTELDAATVGKTLKDSAEFVRGQNRNEAGDLVYTSRKMHRLKALSAK